MFQSAFRDWVKRLQKCVSVCFSRLGKKVTKMCFSKRAKTLKVCNKNMFDKT